MVSISELPVVATKLLAPTTSVMDSPPPLKVREAAHRLNRSRAWVRKYFSQFDDVLRTGEQRQHIMIPVAVFEREWHNLQGV
jgi:hypothetical protein